MCAAISALEKKGVLVWKVRVGAEYFYNRDETRTVSFRHQKGECCVCSDDGGLKMKCGHFICPDDILNHAWEQIKHLKFEISCASCPAIINADDIIRFGLPDWEEKQFIEAAISVNFCESQDIQQCPSCQSYCQRKKTDNPQVHCTICTKKQKKDYAFCWYCLRKWNNPGNYQICGNDKCRRKDIDKLLKTPQKQLNDRKGAVLLFLTPNGRFKVNERICFSLSDFHPEEWKPAYSVTSVLRGVYGFMHEATDTIGSIDATDSERRRLARASMQYNRDNFIFCKFFPHLCIVEDSPDEGMMDTIEIPNYQVHRSPSPDSQSMEITPVENTYIQQPRETDVILQITDPSLAENINYQIPRSPSPGPTSMETTPFENNDIYLQRETYVSPPTIDPALAENIGYQIARQPSPALVPMETTPVVHPYFQESRETSVSLPNIATSLVDNSNDQFPTSPSPDTLPPMDTIPVENTELPQSMETSITPSIIATTIVVNDNDKIHTSPSPVPPSIETTPVGDPNILQPTDMNFGLPFTITYSTGCESPLDTGHNIPIHTEEKIGDESTIRGIIVPTGIVGNILPGEKYYQDYTVPPRSGFPDNNRFVSRSTSDISNTANHPVGYSFIHSTTNSVEVSNLNNYLNIALETIQKGHKNTDCSPVSPYYSKFLLHRAGDQDYSKRLEEGTLPFKEPYSKTVMSIGQIQCYSVFLLYLVLAYGLIH